MYRKKIKNKKHPYYIYVSSDDLKKIFDESIGSTKAYFVSKVQQKYPRLEKKDIETWFKSQEVVQINGGPSS